LPKNRVTHFSVLQDSHGKSDHLASLRFARFFRFLCFIWFDELLLAVRCEQTRKIAVWEEKARLLCYLMYRH
jgi:hypothetical protein